MKRHHSFALLVSFALILSFSTVYAGALSNPPAQGTNILEQIKEKKQLIRQYMKDNVKLEKQTQKKYKDIQKLLTDLYENNTITQPHIENQIKPNMTDITRSIKQVSQMQVPIWKHLNKSRDSIEAKDYIMALHYLNNAAQMLESKHTLLMDLNSKLDEFFDFLKSLDQK